MALTVTATLSGAEAVGFGGMKVDVLNNASYLLTGATSNSITVTTPELAITPTATGNRIYGAVTTGASSGGFSSPAANTTSLYSIPQASIGSWTMGGFRSTGDTTSTTSTVYGFGAPTEAANTIIIALAELLAAGGGSISVDASSPAAVTGTASLSMTTASFTPPGASVLVACVSAPWGNTGTVNVALSDSASSYNWTELSAAVISGATLASVWVGIPKNPPAAKHPSPAVTRPPGRFAPAALAPFRPAVPVKSTPFTGANAGLATATGTAFNAAAGMTVTATASGAGSFVGTALAVRVLNNAAIVQSGATGATFTATTPEGTITPGASGNLVYGSLIYGGGATALTGLLANTTSIMNQADPANGVTAGMFVSAAGTTTSPTTYGWTAPTTTSGNIQVVLAEIQGSGGTIAEDASTPAPVYNPASLSAVSPPFTPPLTSALLAIVEADWTGVGGQGVSVSVTDSEGAYTWTKLVQGDPTIGLVSIWIGISGTVAPAGLATATGTALPPVADVIANAGLATATGTASQQPAQAGLAHASGTAFSPVPLAEPNAGLATATGTAFNAKPAAPAQVATATGTALAPVADVIANAGLATATGTAFPPSTTGSTTVFPGLAAATGTAQPPAAQVTAFAGLATATGTAFKPGLAYTAGLAHGTGTALSPKITVTAFAGLATATGLAGAPAFPTQLPHWGVTFTEPGPSAVLTENAFGAVLTLPGFGGALVPVTGLASTLTTPNYGGSLAVPNYGATLSLANLGAVITGGTMQQASLTLSEFNDMTINIAVTNNGSPFNLTGYNLSLLLKSAAGVPDNTALVFSSTGGSPAITITSASAGLATAQLPNTDLDSESYSFYRLDVVNASSQQQTTVYGNIIWITL